MPSLTLWAFAALLLISGTKSSRNCKIPDGMSPGLKIVLEDLEEFNQKPNHESLQQWSSLFDGDDMEDIPSYKAPTGAAKKGKKASQPNSTDLLLQDLIKFYGEIKDLCKMGDRLPTVEQLQAAVATGQKLDEESLFCKIKDEEVEGWFTSLYNKLRGLFCERK